MNFDEQKDQSRLLRESNDKNLESTKIFTFDNGDIINKNWIDNIEGSVDRGSLEKDRLQID